MTQLRATLEQVGRHVADNTTARGWEHFRIVNGRPTEWAPATASGLLEGLRRGAVLLSLTEHREIYAETFADHYMPRDDAEDDK